MTIARSIILLVLSLILNTADSKCILSDVAYALFLPSDMTMVASEVIIKGYTPLGEWESSPNQVSGDFHNGRIQKEIIIMYKKNKIAMSVNKRVAAMPNHKSLQPVQPQSNLSQKRFTSIAGLPNPPSISIKHIKYAIERNEDADAQLFVIFNKDKCRFDYDEGAWYVFNGVYWERDLNRRVLKLFKNILSWHENAAAFIESKNLDKHKKLKDDIRLRIKQLSSLSRKKNVLSLAEGNMGISTSEWDADLMALGFENGVLDLQSGDFRSGNPGDFIKTVCPIEWKGKEAPCPTWHRFISDTFIGHAETIGFLQRLLGSSLAGEIREHVFIIFYGIGRNGKGLILETMSNILGGYAFKIKSNFLLSQRFAAQSGAADADTKSLKGKRFAYASETSRAGQLDTSKIKELVGGDTLNARGLWDKQPSNFEPTHTLFLMTNNKPNVSNDFAFWERAILVNFPLSFVNRTPVAVYERKADLELKKKLLKEAPGIMAWLVQGCLDWQKQGLNPPAAVSDATQEYKEEEDIFGNFIKDKCELGESYTVQANILYAAYCDWCEDNGFKIFNNKQFGKEFKKLFESTRTSRGIIYKGIRVINTLS